MACPTNYDEQDAANAQLKRIQTTSYAEGERLITSQIHQSTDTMVQDASTNEITTIKDAAIQGNDALVNITIGTTNAVKRLTTCQGAGGEL